MKAVGAIFMSAGLIVAMSDEVATAVLGVLLLGIGYLLAFAFDGEKGKGGRQ